MRPLEQIKDKTAYEIHIVERTIETIRRDYEEGNTGNINNSHLITCLGMITDLLHSINDRLIRIEVDNG